MRKTIVVIGAESGIGFATAKSLQQRGHTVWTTAKDLDGINILEKAFPHERILMLDLANAADISTMIAPLQNIESIDALICNAGVGTGGPVSHIDIPDLREAFQINVFGHLEIIQGLLPTLERASDPRIIWTGSAAGYFVRPLFGGYASTKYAVNALSDALRVELMGRVHVSLITPGRIKTAIWEKGMLEVDKFQGRSELEVYDSAFKKLANEMKVNRVESPSVDIVVKAMNHAVSSKRPKPYYRIGIDAKAAFWLKWLLPTRWVDIVLRTLCW
ncbi:MAG: hypothetical protein CL916_03585 [Deltaproteobacteria bacterium]|nr:hypothetical protein [Deltaproteobacteria bacterium]